MRDQVPPDPLCCCAQGRTCLTGCAVQTRWTPLGLPQVVDARRGTAPCVPLPWQHRYYRDGPQSHAALRVRDGVQKASGHLCLPGASGWPRGGFRVASSVLSLSTTETFGSVCVCGLPTARGSECHSLLVLQVLPFVHPGHNPELPNWESVLFCWHLSQEPCHTLASQEERGLCVEGLREGKDLVPDRGQFSSLHLVALTFLASETGLPPTPPWRAGDTDGTAAALMNQAAADIFSPCHSQCSRLYPGSLQAFVLSDACILGTVLMWQRLFCCHAERQ